MTFDDDLDDVLGPILGHLHMCFFFRDVQAKASNLMRNLHGFWGKFIQANPCGGFIQWFREHLNRKPLISHEDHGA